jgi:hypothetical protein
MLQAKDPKQGLNVQSAVDFPSPKIAEDVITQYIQYTEGLTLATCQQS